MGVLDRRVAAEQALSACRQLLEGSALRYAPDGAPSASYWPLFLDDPANPDARLEIDTCATALGILALRTSRARTADTPSPAGELAALGALIGMRRSDGSWPSIAPIAGDFDPDSLPDGTVNDTVFALEALIGFGFGLPDFQVNWQAHQDLSRFRLLRPRLAFIEETVRWLEENRLGQAWHYTPEGSLASDGPPAAKVGPTANAVSALARLRNQLRPVKTCGYVGSIDELVSTAAEWLARCQLPDGGFGRDPSDGSLLAHTIASGSALLEADSSRYSHQVRRALRWVMKHGYTELSSAPSMHFFDEYTQNVVVNNRSFSKRVIHHEYAVEARALSFLADGFTSRSTLGLTWLSATRLLFNCERMFRRLSQRQVPEGSFRGAFVSRRELYGERYPIYWVYYGAIGVADYVRTTKDSFAKRLTKELLLQALIVAAALGIYAYVSRPRLGELVAAIAIGVAANLVTPAIRKAR